VPVGARICTPTGILSRAEQGCEVDQIANDIGMSRQNVEHDMRFGDHMKVGADGQNRLGPDRQGGLDHERCAGYISDGSTPDLQNSWY
jgi:hypothetical protein